ncbi:MAG: SPASM domain-containing protein [Streptosporangiaceae bacterium]|nr:SPASM domain-containing protein [Streptosporangiaceae bacterium]
MLTAQPGRRAVAVSAFDLPDAQQLLLHGCEDCACPVTTELPPPVADRLDLTLSQGSRWTCGPEIFEVRLDAEHRLLFNPVGSGGVVVVNDPAYRIFRCFQQPSTLAEVRAALRDSRDDADAIFDRLRQLEIIYPVGQPVVRPVFEVPKVLTAWLHISNACNLRCPYCYVNKSAEGMDEHVGRATIAAVARSAVANGFRGLKLKYAGGEASLNRRLLVRLHTYARTLSARHGLELYATLLSNGVALPRPLVETLRAEEIRVMISLDGVGSDHDAQRPFMNGKPSFRFVERTIAQLMEQDHAPHLSITITNRNAGGVANVVRFALERNLTFSLNFFRDNDCAINFPDLRYKEQVMIDALLDAFAVIEEHLPPWSILGSILDRGQLLEPRQRTCGVGQDYVVIDHRGKVAKCHMEIERTLGDVFRDDPLRLVQRDTSTVLNLLVDDKEGCRDCTWRYWCSGGCSVATFRATGRYDIKSPNCGIYKAIYPRALRLEGLRLLKYAAI